MEVRRTATGYILDNDSMPSVSINGDSGTEGSDSTLDFLVTLSHPSALSPTVQYATIPGSATSEGASTLFSDYSAASGHLYFSQEYPYQWISVSLGDDQHCDGGTEEFYVELTSPSGATPGTMWATGTIYDNDGEPLVTIDPASCRESAGQMTFTLHLSNASQSPAEVTWETAVLDGSYSSSAPGLAPATPGDDYTPTTGTAVFQPGETETTATVPILDDSYSEADEGFLLRVTGTTGCTIDPNAYPSGTATAVGTIEDDGDTVILVNSTGDAEDCDLNDGVRWTGDLNAEGDPEVTLRAAIQQLNASGGSLDTIEFAVPTSDPDYDSVTGVFVIAPQSELPAIQWPVRVEGDTQPGYNGRPVIVLNGAQAGTDSNGLRLSAGSTFVYDLAVNRFAGAGILVSGNGDNYIVGCFVGTDAAGLVAQGNGCGIAIVDSPNNVVAGTATSLSIVSGNTDSGIMIQGANATGNRVQGTLVGTRFDGMAPLPNGKSGVAIFGGASGNIIGTDGNGTNDTIEGNVLSGNKWCGVRITGSGSNNNVIAGNKIGVGSDGMTAVPNESGGVLIEDEASQNQVGRSAPGTSPQSNTIACNYGRGVAVVSGTRNVIRGNAIFENARLGIDLDRSGVSANDSQDGDPGANNVQNYPIVVSLTPDGGNTVVAGVLNSAANTTFRVELFSNTAQTAAGYSQGRTYLGSTNVTTDGEGNAPFTFTASGSPQFVTATATDPDGNTSEFSPVGGQMTISYLPTGQGTLGDLTNDNPDGTANTPAFAGGYRFFPDAATYQTSDASRNIVRIRAVVPGAAAGTPVYFRAFDVDDPSSNPIIDPDDNGRDNRGRLADEEEGVEWWRKPGESLGGGYQGRFLVDGEPTEERAVVAVNTVMRDGVAIAEIDLITSFAPGDNLRVVAALDRQAVAALDSDVGVPTTGAIAGFSGAITDQLSVWRRFHVERDRMAHTESEDKRTGEVRAVEAILGLDQQPIPGMARVFLDAQMMRDHEYDEGIFRYGGTNYHIVASAMQDAVTNASVDIIADPNAVSEGEYTIYQSDFSPIGNDGAQMIQFQVGGTQNGLTTLLTNQTLVGNEFQGGFVCFSSLGRVGTPYRVLSNTGGANASITVETGNDAIQAMEGSAYRPLGTALPTTLVDTTDDAHLYDQLQPTTDRSANRYADAYMQADLHSLDTFSSNNNDADSFVPATPHVNEDATSMLRAITSPVRESATNSALWSNLFWSTYVTTAFEYKKTDSNRPDVEEKVMGVRVGLGDFGEPVCAVFLQPIRHYMHTHMALADDQARAFATVHELGHEFGLLDTTTGTHIMNTCALLAVAASSYFFDAADVVKLRANIDNPS